MTSKPALIFLHGFMGSASDWKPVIARIGSRYSCKVVNLPPHKSFRSLERGVPSRSSSILVGYSMGGRLALHMALRRKCRALVLVSTSPGIENAADRRKRRAADERWARRLESGNPKSFLRDWYSQPVFAGMTASQERKLKKPAELANMLRGLSPGRQPSQWKKLPRLGMPVLIVTGSCDKLYRTVGARMARLCPQARHVIVPRSSHVVHREKPARLAREIRDFLSEVLHE